MRYHIFHFNAEDCDLVALGMPEEVFNVRAAWDRKVGGHGLKCIQIQLSAGNSRAKPEWIDVVDGHEDHDPDNQVFTALHGVIDQDGRCSADHVGFEDDCLPEFAGGQPSKRKALERLSSKLHDELSVINDSIYEMNRRMRDHDFDGDYDPNESNKKKRAELRAQCDALDEALGAMPDDRTAYELAIDEREEESNRIAAEMDAEDRHTRWQEGGWAEKQYSDYGDDD